MSANSGPRGFDAVTQRILALAHELANGRAGLTPVHLALALVRDRRNRAVALLRSLRVPVDEFERQLAEHLPPEGEPQVTRATDAWSVTDAEILTRLEVEATETDARFVLCEHLLLAILRDSRGIPARLLAPHGVDHPALQARLMRGYEASRRQQRNDLIEGVVRFTAAVAAVVIELELARSGPRWPLLAIPALVMTAVSFLVYRRTRTFASAGMTITAPVVVPLTLWLGAEIALAISSWPMVLRIPMLATATFLIGAFLFIGAIIVPIWLGLALRWRS